MPRISASILLALSALGAAACHDEPLRPSDTPPQPARTIARTIDGKAVRVRYDGQTATVSVDGRATLRVRYDGERRHVTAFLADGRTLERSYTRRELAEAAAGALPGAPRPALDFYDDGYDEGYDSVSDGSEESLKCSKEWVTYAGASLVAVVTCSATGPTPPCAAAVAAAAVALDALITCELKNASSSI